MQNTRPKMQNTSMPTTKDELAEIERSAQMMGREGTEINPNGTSSQRTFADSSCTSMYLEDDSFYADSFSSKEMSWQSSGAVQMKSAPPPGGPRRNSVLMSPAGMVGMAGIDFEDSDDDTDEDSSPPQGPPSGGTGNPNHRPMVGGFAAAAYEAARADHYKKQQAKKKPPA